MFLLVETESGYVNGVYIDDDYSIDNITYTTKDLERLKLITNNKYYDTDYSYYGSIKREISLSPESIIKNNTILAKEFLKRKELEGHSKKTILRYKIVMKDFIYHCIKPFSKVNTKDIRKYLEEYKAIDLSKGKVIVSNGTLNDIKRILSSLFNFLCEDGYVSENIVKRISKIKEEDVIKVPFSEDDIIKIKDSCSNIFELSIIDFLNSSGVRVSEICDINIQDMSIDKKQGIVFGKGKKERIIYIDTATKIHLSKYLKTRTDKNDALFVIKYRDTIKRITPSFVENLCKLLSIKSGVINCHPHRFRRTLATRLLRKGVPIEQVQKILGHSRIETTLIYTKINQDDIKRNHEKFC